MTALSRKRLHYRNSPEFRARVIERVKSRHERDSSDPDYVRLVSLRKRISQTRGQIGSWLERVRLAEIRLIDMVRERDQIAAHRSARKAGRVG